MGLHLHAQHVKMDTESLLAGMTGNQGVEEKLEAICLQEQLQVYTMTHTHLRLVHLSPPACLLEACIHLHW